MSRSKSVETGLSEAADLSEAEEHDLYKFGTKLCEYTVLLLVDEFEARTPVARLEHLLDSNNAAGLQQRGPGAPDGAIEGGEDPY